jgi:hypothetical protein
MSSLAGSESSHRNDPGDTDLKTLLELFAIRPVQSRTRADIGEKSFIYCSGKFCPLKFSPIDPCANHPIGL